MAKHSSRVKPTGPDCFPRAGSAVRDRSDVSKLSGTAPQDGWMPRVRFLLYLLVFSFDISTARGSQAF